MRGAITPSARRTMSRTRKRCRNRIFCPPTRLAEAELCFSGYNCQKEHCVFVGCCLKVPCWKHYSDLQCVARNYAGFAWLTTTKKLKKENGTCIIFSLLFTASCKEKKRRETVLFFIDLCLYARRAKTKLLNGRLWVLPQT